MKHKIDRVEIHYVDAPHITIWFSDLDKMLQAQEAIDLINTAKGIAVNLVKSCGADDS